MAARWALFALLLLVLFFNHWARDSVGALEPAMEAQLGLTNELDLPPSPNPTNARALGPGGPGQGRPVS